jgi:hypothetical protein
MAGTSIGNDWNTCLTPGAPPGARGVSRLIKAGREKAGVYRESTDVYSC